MDNKEAISYLQWARPKQPYTQDRKNVQTAIDMAIEALKDRPHGEWIPCSERLPEKDGKYLVKWCGDWGVDVCIAEYSQGEKYWYRDSDGYELRNINAWMPIPEPYKEEGDENG